MKDQARTEEEIDHELNKNQSRTEENQSRFEEEITEMDREGEIRIEKERTPMRGRMKSTITFLCCKKVPPLVDN